ncbi:MAG TPA: hypothetical protein VK013_00190 [Myxococcaceae bacterium]|nr:hypothetical protein [Myxococcaceae bacterium]
MASSFERDFGYLLPFLDRVTQAASDHPDARVRAELVSLLADEKARWVRVRELLSAKPGHARADALGPTFRKKGEGAHQAEPVRSAAPRSEPPAPRAPVSASEEATAASPLQGTVYTVGPLRSGR